MLDERWSESNWDCVQRGEIERKNKQSLCRTSFQVGSLVLLDSVFFFLSLSLLSLLSMLSICICLPCNRSLFISEARKSMPTHNLRSLWFIFHGISLFLSLSLSFSIFLYLSFCFSLPALLFILQKCHIRLKICFSNGIQLYRLLLMTISNYRNWRWLKMLRLTVSYKLFSFSRPENKSPTVKGPYFHLFPPGKIENFIFFTYKFRYIDQSDPSTRTVPLAYYSKYSIIFKALKCIQQEISHVSKWFSH